MAKRKRLRPKRGKHVALILVEGETDEEFYARFATTFFRRASKKVNNLKGNFNVNAKIADAATSFAQANRQDTFDVYVCLDQERIGAPPFNEQLIRKTLAPLKNFRAIVPVIAVLMIESLFFIDIEGMYGFLRTPKARRKPQKYRNFRSLTHRDLSALFGQVGKRYYKGHRCEGLVNALDLNKLEDSAEELNTLIDKVKGKKRPKKRGRASK